MVGRGEAKQTEYEEIDKFDLREVRPMLQYEIYGAIWLFEMSYS
jgi:hypothetical protein